MRPLSHRRQRPGIPLGFRIWFAFVGAVMLGIFVAMGVLAYNIATNPEGAGHFIGRVVGGVVDGAKPSPTTQTEE